MPNRSIKVTLQAQVAGYNAAMLSASRATDKVRLSADTAGGRLAEFATKNQANAQKAGTALTAFGAVTVAALAGTAKAAIDWETAWTGVTKTVEGTPQQLAEVEDGLRKLTHELPASHAEIAAVAEAAGQLGISTGGVVEFTKTMINLGETTNLSADEAATALARFSNIMGTSESQVDNVGAAIVGLGNNFATTEAEIVAMSLRLSGAGKQAGFTEGEVLGLATAMSSVGIEAEAGGTAMSMTIKDIGKAVDDGGDKLALFAEVSGMTSEEFATAWGEDAAGTLAVFTEGLADTSSTGMTMNGVLDELDIKGIRQSDSLIRLASSQGILTEALELGNTAYAENTALVEEAAKRYDTAESKIRIAWNTIKDAAITIGEVAVPAIASLADGVGGLVSAFSELPDWVQKVVGGLTGLSGVAALAAGGALLGIPKYLELRNAFKELSKVSPRAAKGLGKVGGAMKGIGIAGVALAGTTIALGALFDAILDDAPSAAEAMNALVTNTDLAAYNEQISGMSYGFDDLKGAADNLFNTDAMTSGLVKGLGFIIGNNDYMHKSEEAFESLGQSLAALYDSDPSEAAEKFKLIQEETEATTEELLSVMPAYADALANTETEATLAADAQGELGGATEETTGAVEEQTDALLESIEAHAEAAGVVLSTRDAQRQFEASVDDAKAAVKENGATLDINTEKGRANQAALDDVATSALDVAESMRESGASAEDIQGTLDDSKNRFINLAESMGMSSDDARELADELFDIPDVDATVSVDYGNSLANVQAVIDILGGVKDKRVQLTVEKHNLTVNETISLASSRASSGRGKTLKNADGGLWDFYANGGLRENHVAQIAPAGSWRVWGEEETGGEAYIPLADSKRGRSMDILGEVATRFGQALIPMADGAAHVGPTGPVPYAYTPKNQGPASVSKTYQSTVHNYVRPMTPQDLLMAQKRGELLDVGGRG